MATLLNFLKAIGVVILIAIISIGICIVSDSNTVATTKTEYQSPNYSSRHVSVNGKDFIIIYYVPDPRYFQVVND